MRRLVILAFCLWSGPLVAQVCNQSFTLRSSACPAGALDCTNKGATLTYGELDDNIINLIDLCKPFDVASTAVTVEGDWTFDGTLTTSPTTTPGIVLTDSDGGGTPPAAGHGRIYGNLTDTTASLWDFDLWLCQQVNGSENCPVYLDADGTGDGRVQLASGSIGSGELVSPNRMLCSTKANISATENDIPIGPMPYAATVVAVGCRVSGTSGTALFEDVGSNQIKSGVTCSAGSTAITWDSSSLTNTSFSSGEFSQFDITAQSSAGYFTGCVLYTVP